MQRESKKITLRAAKSSDESFVNALTQSEMTRYVKQTWSSDLEYKSYFERNKFKLETTKIIQLDGKDVGRFTVTRSAESIYLDNIHVLGQYQSHGIGRFLIQTLFDEAAREAKDVKLSVLRTNPAKSLYERLGFKVLEESPTHFLMIRAFSSN